MKTPRILPIGLMFLFATVAVAATQQQQLIQPEPSAIRVGGNVQSAKMIRKVMPVYPPMAKREGISGTVVLKALIGADGSVVRLQYVSGPPLLVHSALEAARQWQYEPTLLNGKPVEVETTISVVYSLAGPRKETSGKAAAPPAPAEKTAPGTVRLGAQVQAGKLVHRVLPVYPPMAKRAKISGTVVLKALIGKDGSVEKLKYVSGPPPLVRSAMKAVRQWQYAPTHLKGKPVKVDTVIRVVYSLGDKKRPANAKGSGGR